jgi:hypothetical protein
MSRELFRLVGVCSGCWVVRDSRTTEQPLYSFLNDKGGGWSTPHPDRFIPWKEPVPFVEEAGWDPGLVWRGAENLAPTGIRSPDRPARSESLNF